MKKIYYLIAVATLFVLASCSNIEEITESVPDVKKYTPVVSGVFGNFADETPSTRAGVIEDNVDYATEGEKFYWHDGDQVKLVFIDTETSVRTEITYTANVEVGDTSNVAEFTASDGIPEGTYTVYGLHPAAGWTWDGTNYIASLEAPDPIDGISSAYLGRNLFMKAKAENVTIGDESDNSIDLSYKHLGGVIRFHIRNDFVDNFPRVGEISLDKVTSDDGGVNITLVNYFTTTARLEDLDSDVLTPIAQQGTVPVTFADGVSALDFDFYLPILPVDGFNENEALRIQAYVGESTTPQSLFSSGTSAPFLSDGFNAGFSYFIRLTQWGAAAP